MAAHDSHPSSSMYLGSPLEKAKFCVCDVCRIKKIKCDMVRPVCGNCRLRYTDCTYSKRKRKPGPPKRRDVAEVVTPAFPFFSDTIQEPRLLSPSTPMFAPWTIDSGHLLLDSNFENNAEVNVEMEHQLSVFSTF